MVGLQQWQSYVNCDGGLVCETEGGQKEQMGGEKCRCPREIRVRDIGVDVLSHGTSTQQLNPDVTSSDV